MPFVQRVVEPVFLSRRNAASEDEDVNKSLTDYELETVANTTLSNALRQLASLVLIANDIFDSLTKELEDVRDRSSKLRMRIEAVEGKVSEYDPKTVTVPESDLCSFASRTQHFSACHAPATGLFAAETRPSAVRCLYAAAAPTPVPVMRQLDRYRRDGARCSRYFSCTPVLLGGPRHRRRSARRRAGGAVSPHDASAASTPGDVTDASAADAIDIEDIETSMPAALSALRRWTSEEALGDVTVAPDCSRLPAAAVLAALAAAEAEAAGAEAAAAATAAAAAGADGADHRLPSPEEQAAVVAARFPGEMVAVDVSGRAFRRMSLLRRSLALDPRVGGRGGAGAEGGATGAEGSSSSASRSRRPRSRRRNTIAGTDRRELRRALNGESHDESDARGSSLVTADDSAVGGSRSDSQKIKDTSSSEGIKAHFNSLKQWGKGKLKLIKGNNMNENGSKVIIEPSEESNIYETVTVKGKKADLKNEKKVTASGSLPISTQSGAMNMAVKLRQRQTRTGKDDALHSSSGNWSASSESGRASIGSETTHQPKSTTTLSSAATSSNSLNHHHPSSSVGSRRKFLNTSTSSSVSEGTLTPDIVSDFTVPFVDDGETSSIYSCDTEGYYTSFHLDSGLKTLKEEEVLSTPQTPLHSTSALSNSPGRANSTLTAENEYELFGKGSTSTTTSSAGTVCTTLLVSNNESNLSLARGPTVPERKSSLDQKDNGGGANSQMVVAMVHKQRGCEMSESPDSGHNTSSSPVDSTSSPHGTLTGRSSEYEFSESDLEGVDRLERIRVKTTINSSRIPSMCVITPPPSDDETSLSQYVPSNRHKASVPSSNSKNRMSLLETDFGANIIHTQEKNVYLYAKPSEEKSQAVIPEEKPTCIASKQIGDETVQNSVAPSTLRPLRFSPKFAQKDTARKVNKTTSQTDQDRLDNLRSSLLPPFNNMFGKMREVLSSTARKDFGGVSSTKAEKTNKDSGDYVTISKTVSEKSSLPSPDGNQDVKSSEVPAGVDMEYVSLNELPVSRTSSTANILISPSNSLERKRRQGARVTLDSEGKVIYSSDSLRRNKASHTTFEPGPYVKDTLTSPTASPLMLHRTVKQNIRPVSLSNQGGNNIPPSTVSKPLSPIPDNRQFSSPTRIASPISPKLGKVIIRAGNKTNVRVTSPVSSGPVITSTHPVSPQPTRGAYVKMKSPDEHLWKGHNPGQSPFPGPNVQEEGKPALHAHPPQYVEPPPVRQEVNVREHLRENLAFGSKEQSDISWTHQLDQQHNGVAVKRYTTQNVHPTYPISSTLNPCDEYNTNNMQREFHNVPRHGAYITSQKAPMYYSYSAKQNHTKTEEHTFSNKLTRFPTPATIPSVPDSHSPQLNRKQSSMQHDIVHSSTPTKNDRRDSLMEISSVLSPIQKCEYNSYHETLKNGHVVQPTTVNHLEKNDNVGNLQNLHTSLLSKTSMSAEELFAAIHKSKKKLNIKDDFDNYYRSGSPSSSSVNSLSPGSSESSINGTRSACSNETLLGIENTSRNRHSWSPNAKHSLDFQTYQQNSHFHSAESKQSRASDRLGPLQPTSRNDFKRLLLQQGSKTNGLGTYRGKLSAVEQLRMSRQQRHNMPQNGSTVNGGYLPLSPSDKRYNGPKLLPSPRSAAAWRFASPRTDILSSTILEDCAEEEKASFSQEENDRQSKSLTMTAESSHRNTLSKDGALTISDKHITDHSDVFRKSDTHMSHTPITNFGKKTPSNLSPRTQVPGETFGNNIDYRLRMTSKGSMSSAPLSPSNVKENVDTNKPDSLQFSSLYKMNSHSLPESQLANLRARQLFMQQQNSFSNKESIITPPTASRVQITVDKQKQNSYNSRGSPARSILAQIERKSPSRTTLETAL